MYIYGRQIMFANTLHGTGEILGATLYIKIRNRFIFITFSKLMLNYKISIGGKGMVLHNPSERRHTKL